jgi:prephenate dehydrogenase
MRIALLGLGLVGGSIARALRADGAGSMPVERIVAWSPTAAGPWGAVEAGVVDSAASSVAEAVTGVDLVILAAPPTECLDLIRLLGELRDRLGPDTLVTDVASTKARIVSAAVEAHLPFVGGHPMAGSGATGFGAASADLFRGRAWVVVPGATSPADGPERVDALARACGSRPVRLDAATHDRAVAAISHVPLVLAAALVEAVLGTADGPERPDRTVEAALASSGWASMTRLALGSPQMGAGIATTNASEIAAGLREVRASLDAWIDALEADAVDGARLLERFSAACDRLARMSDKPS